MNGELWQQIYDQHTRELRDICRRRREQEARSACLLANVLCGISGLIVGLLGTWAFNWIMG